MNTLKVMLNDNIYVDKNFLSQDVVDKLKEELILINPKWLENQRQNRWNGNTPKKLYFIEKYGDLLIIPRGFLNNLLNILIENNINFYIKDNTRISPIFDYNFKKTLHDYQEKAVKNILTQDLGVLQSPTGSGKTVIALKVIAERKQPTLIIVHTKELLNQWKDRAKEFLGLKDNDIGVIGDGKKQLGRPLTVAIINSLYKCSKDLKDKIGFVITDECHKIPSRSMYEGVKAFDARYILGLSATPYRRDGLTKVIHFYCGETIHIIKNQELHEVKKVMKGTLKVRHTNFDYKFNDDYQTMITELIKDKDRNCLIAQDAGFQQHKSGVCLILTDRKIHCYILKEFLKDDNLESTVLVGSLAKKEREEIIKDLNGGKIKILIATGQLIGEGFDYKNFTSIFLTTPIRSKNRVTQYIGRILRVMEGKKNAMIYDYVDCPGVLKNAYYDRRKVYKELGVEL